MLGFVILSYNHPELTAQTLTSVLNLVPPERVAVLHNGSEAKCVQGLQARFANIRHWVLSQNGGFSGGANAALTYGFENWDWVTFLTNDCELLTVPTPPGTPSLIAPQILVRKSAHVDSVGGAFHPRTARLKHCKTTHDFTFPDRGWVQYVPGTAFLIHKQVFEDVGGFDESLGTYWEDVDFSQRVLQKKHLLQTDPHWQLRHKIGKTCHKHTHYTLYLFQRNRKRVSWRYTPVWQRPVLAGHLLTSWAHLTWRLWKKGRSSDVPLLWRAVRH